MRTTPPSRHVRAPAALVVPAAAFLLLFPCAADAQAVSDAEESPRAAWASAGLGPASMGLAGGASVSVQARRGVIGLRWIEGGTFDPMGDGTGKDLGDVALTYSRGSVGVRSRRSAGLGLAMVYGTEKRLTGGWMPEERDIGPTVGIALEMRLDWQPLDWGGVGLWMFSNLNSDSPFGGVLGVFHVGRLR